ncbi:MAG: carbohydrate ABC transporter permease, partial [Candidatus Methanomethylicia archaeon]
MKIDLNRLIIVFIAILLALFTLFPIIWVLVSSLKTRSAIFSTPIKWIPNPITLASYQEVFTYRPFGRIIINSIIVGFFVVFLSFIAAIPAAYALARLKIKWKIPILMLILSPYIFPAHTLVAPLYLLFRSLGWINTYQCLIIPYTSFSLPLAVWLLTIYINAIPKELDEAARMDGANNLKVLLNIIMPLLKPGLVTTGLLVFMGSWVEFMYALTFTVNEQAQTIPVAIGSFYGRYAIPWGEISAASIIAIIPLATIIMLFQQYLIKGI